MRLHLGHFLRLPSALRRYRLALARYRREIRQERLGWGMYRAEQGLKTLGCDRTPEQQPSRPTQNTSP